MFSLMVFEGRNIYSKQNKEGAFPPRVLLTDRGQTLASKGKWIRCVDREQR